MAEMTVLHSTLIIQTFNLCISPFSATDYVARYNIPARYKQGVNGNPISIMASTRYITISQKRIAWTNSKNIRLG